MFLVLMFMFVLGLVTGGAIVLVWAWPVLRQPIPMRYIKPVTDYSRHRQVVKR